MEFVLHASKNIYYLISFAAFALALLLTGATKAKDSISDQGFIAKDYTNLKSFLKNSGNIIESVFLPLGTMVAIYSLADMFKYEIVKSLITENLIYIMLVYIACILLFNIAIILKFSFRARRNYFYIYYFILLERAHWLYKTMIDISRVILQCLIFVFVPYILFMSLQDIYLYNAIANSFILKFICILLFLVAIEITRRRVKHGLLLLDIGYMLSSLAIFAVSFIGTSIFKNDNLCYGWRAGTPIRIACITQGR